MPSFQDSVIIFILALILFGPKKLPQLARQLGKLMAEFRRASNDFRMQMEEEMRISEQEENQKKLASYTEAPAEIYPTGEPEHPHLPSETAEPAETITPIATEGNITMMPPSSGYPEPAAASGVKMASSNAGVVSMPETLPTETPQQNEPDLMHG